MRHPSIPTLLALIVLTSAAHAQWNTDPAVNLSVADAASDQVQPKVVPTSDGGFWVSWFDGIANGFDVRVQKLDVLGFERLTHNGVLVADRGFTSTQDYGLDVGSAGDALLAYRDDGGTGIQITASSTLPDGSSNWSTTLTATTDFVAAPKIAGTSDGGAFVAWTQDVDVHLQKLDASGNTELMSDVVLSPGAGSYSVSDLKVDPVTGDRVILAFVHMTGAFPSPRDLLAQKIDDTGSLLWGAGHVSVFDSGSLQVGNFPTFVSDGAGGAAFGWYDTGSSQLQCYAQHVNASGVEQFPHNGTAASTDLTRVRVSPSVSFDEGTGETFLFWVEQNSGQSQSGVYGQKFNASGTRQWTDTGAVLVAVGTDSITQVRSEPSGGGAFVFWNRAPSAGNDQVYGSRVDGTGSFDFGPTSIATTLSDKSRLAVAKGLLGFAIAAWTDDRVDTGDVLAQNFNADGSFGAPGQTYCDGKTTSQGCVPFILTTGTPSVSDTRGFNIHSLDHVSGQAGLLVYGFGKASLAFHGGTLCVKAPFVRTAAKPAKAVESETCVMKKLEGLGGTARLRRNFNTIIQSGTMPILTVGQKVRAQWFQRDPANTDNAFGDNLSNGVQFTIMP